MGMDPAGFVAAHAFGAGIGFSLFVAIQQFGLRLGAQVFAYEGEAKSFGVEEFHRFLYTLQKRLNGYRDWETDRKSVV